MHSYFAFAFQNSSPRFWNSVCRSRNALLWSRDQSGRCDPAWCAGRGRWGTWTRPVRPSVFPLAVRVHRLELVGHQGFADEVGDTIHVGCLHFGPWSDLDHVAFADVEERVLADQCDLHAGLAFSASLGETSWRQALCQMRSLMTIVLPQAIIHSETRFAHFGQTLSTLHLLRTCLIKYTTY